ncbi:calcium release-activated calcium channel protein 1-like [Ptychodera flava]|uniref:calcium release-activated calcium channel protein 1-like n=1 Tax=Ptychodera flava TaxID=63121 RepID=UPI00396A480C
MKRTVKILTQGVSSLARAVSAGPAVGGGGGTPYTKLGCRSYLREMSNQQNVHALSWRKLYLSRAKLKASSRTSALMAGFAMVAMVEVHLEYGHPIPDPLLVTFSVCTVVLVTVNLFALLISTCILPHIEAVSSGKSDTAFKDSPHINMSRYIDIAWACSTAIGIMLFLCEIAIICWIKFYHHSTNAAIAATAVVAPCAVVFCIFALHFYRSLVKHKYEQSTQTVEELEHMALQLQQDNGAPPADTTNA